MDDKPKILIVDDQPWIRLDLKYELGKVGDFEIFEASNSIEGLERFYESGPDIVFLDLNMQDDKGLKTKLAGLEVLRKIKSHAPSIFVVIHTGYEDLVLIEEATKRDADAILLKGKYTTSALVDLFLDSGINITISPSSVEMSRTKSDSGYRVLKESNSQLGQSKNMGLLGGVGDRDVGSKTGYQRFGRWFLNRSEGILDEIIGSAFIALVLFVLGKISGLLQGLPGDWLQRQESIVYLASGVIVLILIIGIYNQWQKRNRNK